MTLPLSGAIASPLILRRRHPHRRIDISARLVGSDRYRAWAEVGHAGNARPAATRFAETGVVIGYPRPQVSGSP